MKSEIIYYMLFNTNIKACHFHIFTNNFTVSLNCKLFMIMKYLMNNCISIASMQYYGVFHFHE